MMKVTTADSLTSDKKEQVRVPCVIELKLGFTPELLKEIEQTRSVCQTAIDATLENAIAADAEVQVAAHVQRLATAALLTSESFQQELSESVGTGVSTAEGIE